MGEKKKKIKLVSGMLCRDNTQGGVVIFYEGCKKKDVILRPKSNLWASMGKAKRVVYYAIDKWEEFYDLKPPLLGRCFEIEIEL